MKPFLAFLIITTVATGAMGQAGRAIRDMTCAQAAGIVASQGAVVLYTGPTTFDRYVRDSSFCARGETAQYAWVRTSDVAQCLIGGTCQQKARGN
jgi:hypothetical protein